MGPVQIEAVQMSGATLEVPQPAEPATPAVPETPTVPSPVEPATPAAPDRRRRVVALT